MKAKVLKPFWLTLTVSMGYFGYKTVIKRTQLGGVLSSSISTSLHI